MFKLQPFGWAGGVLVMHFVVHPVSEERFLVTRQFIGGRWLGIGVTANSVSQ